MKKGIITIIYLLLTTLLSAQMYIEADRKTICINESVNIRWKESITPTTISWDFGDGATPATGSNLTHDVSYSSYGEKVITITAYMSSSNPIHDTLRINVSQLLDTDINLSLTFQQSSTYILNASATIESEISIAPHRFDWTFHNETQSPNNHYTYQFSDTGTYEVKVLVTDAGGCSATKNEFVTVNSIFSAPNVFTPNNDGINDIFIIQSTGTVAFSIEIYDRSGSLVYKPNLEGTELSWDGRNNSGTLVNPGVYYYIVTPESSSGIAPLKGFVHIFHNEK